LLFPYFVTSHIRIVMPSHLRSRKPLRGIRRSNGVPQHGGTTSPRWLAGFAAVLVIVAVGAGFPVLARRAEAAVPANSPEVEPEVQAHQAPQEAGREKSDATVTFEDVTAQMGLSIGGSQAAWGDFDNDGWVDLFESAKVWRNEQGKKFTVAVELPSGSWGGLWGDYDNDGYLDLYCWSDGKLYRNEGGESFKEVTMPEGYPQISRGACWGDFDGDGWLDLYVGGYEVWPAEEFADVIFRNREGRGFVVAWQQQGKPKRARGVTAADFDEDGDLDLYVSNYRLQPNILWLNNGNGVFSDAAQRYGVAGDGALGAWGHTIGSAWGDLDNDGHLDLFVGNFSHPPQYQDRPKFLKNLGPLQQFRFEDKSARAGLHWQESYASPTLGDYDNDGDLDLFFTTVYSGDTSVLYSNNGDWTFTDVTGVAGVGTANTYQGAWADCDNDGDLDLVSGGRLFANTGNDNHWLKVHLKGSGKVNCTAIGTQVRIRLGEQVLTRQVEGATGEGNQNDLTLHFGLGKHTGTVTALIRWPDGTTQTTTTKPDRCIIVQYRPGQATSP